MLQQVRNIQGAGASQVTALSPVLADIPAHPPTLSTLRTKAFEQPVGTPHVSSSSDIVMSFDHPRAQYSILGTGATRISADPC
jgi:hypothetical protein